MKTAYVLFGVLVTHLVLSSKLPKPVYLKSIHFPVYKVYLYTKDQNIFNNIRRNLSQFYLMLPCDNL